MREIDCNSILNKGRLEIKGSCSEIATAIAKVTVATGATLGAIPNLIKNLKNLY